MATSPSKTDAFSMGNISVTESTILEHDLGIVDKEDGGARQDAVDMARFGKKQQLRRGFRFVSIVGLTCTLMITWEGMLITFGAELENRGPAGLVYGFIFVWIGNILQTLVMGEMGSMIPLAGGQYNWIAILAPKSASKFLSYLTGWTAFIAWQAGLASGAYLSGTMIQGLLILNYPDYEFARWQGTLLYYAVVLIGLVINTYLARVLPQIESLTLIFHILGFFGILIPLVYLSPHGSAEAVFATFDNGGSWPTNGVSFFVGLSTGMYAFVGIDAAAHMAEEIKNASTVIPYSMLTSVMLNGILGLAMTIAVLFCVGDVDSVLATPTQYPYIQIFANTTESNSSASAMAAIVIATMMFAALGMLTTASRMTWAFARERGLPFHAYLSRVEPRTKLPIYSIAFSAALSMALGLINIGSSSAFNALTSLTVAGFYSCFAIAAAVHLWRLLRADVAEVKGPFSLGRATIPVIALALVYTVIGLFFSFWPASPNPTAESMNWSIVVYGGRVVFSIIYWVLWGRKIYTGPPREA